MVPITFDPQDAAFNDDPVLQAIFDTGEAASFYVEYEYTHDGDNGYYGDFTIDLHSIAADQRSAQLSGSGIHRSVTTFANGINLNFTDNSLYSTNYDYLERGLTFSYVDDSGNTG